MDKYRNLNKYPVSIYKHKSTNADIVAEVKPWAYFTVIETENIDRHLWGTIKKGEYIMIAGPQGGNIEKVIPHKKTLFEWLGWTRDRSDEK